MAHGQESIQHLLGGLLKNRQLVASMRRVMVMSLWDQVVGTLVAQKSWPEHMRDGILTIGVTSHAWAQELHLLKPQILARYRQLLGRSSVKDVEFRVARRKARTEDAQAASTALHPRREERLPAQPAPVHLLAAVHNPEVRDLLAPVFSRLRAEREWKREHGWARCGQCQRIFNGRQCPQCGGTPDAS